MRFYEFETKRLLAKHGIPVAQGGIAATAAAVEKQAADLGGPVVLKAQVLSPGLLEAGSVKTADSPSQARKEAE